MQIHQMHVKMLLECKWSALENKWSIKQNANGHNCKAVGIQSKCVTIRMQIKCKQNTNKAQLEFGTQTKCIDECTFCTQS